MPLDSRSWTLRQGGQPLLGEVVEERRAGPRRLDVVDPVVGVGHATPGTEGAGDGVEGAGGDGDERGERAHERLAVRVEEHGGVFGRQSVPAGALGQGGVVHGEHAGHRLLLEPLSCVPLVDAGGGGQLRRRARLAVRELLVEAEPGAELDVEQLEGAEAGAEEPLGEGVDGLRVGGCCGGDRHGRAPGWSV